MMKPYYIEYNIICALKEVANGKSLRKACLKWGIWRFTLRDCNAITQIHKETADYLQRLPTVIEDRLTNWILNQKALGYGVIYAQIRVFGERLLAFQGDHLPLGKYWITRFLARNPILKTKKQIYINFVRVNNACFKIIWSWFQKLNILVIKAILIS